MTASPNAKRQAKTDKTAASGEQQMERAEVSRAAAPIDLRDPSLYINRELSQLDFLRRVFEESLDEPNPLLERVKFLAICGMLLDEFYETRVAALRDQQLTGQVVEGGRDALTPTEQLERIYALAREYSTGYVGAAARCADPAAGGRGDLAARLRAAARVAPRGVAAILRARCLPGPDAARGRCLAPVPAYLRREYQSPGDDPRRDRRTVRAGEGADDDVAPRPGAVHPVRSARGRARTASPSPGSSR